MGALPGAGSRPVPSLGPEAAIAWSALLGAQRLALGGILPDCPTSYAVDAAAGLVPITQAAGDALITWSPGAGWGLATAVQGDVRVLLDLYLPLLSGVPGETLTLGHLGQSLDGFIATTRGESCFVTGPENILHLHCLRALCDAVLVGAETVAADDPRLTTRLVSGANPTRVVLDPRRRLPAERRLFQDGAAPTLLVCAEGLTVPGHLGHAEVLAVPAHQGRLRLDALVAALQRRGLRRLFVEGGGLTVSSFLGAGLLDRLHLAVAPLLIGAGRRGLSLPAPPTLGDCLRPDCRVFRMGADILFECKPRELRRGGEGAIAPGLSRVR